MLDLQSLFLLRVLLLAGKGDLNLILLLHLLIGLVLSLGVLLLELFDVFIFLLLEFFKFLAGLVNDFFHFRINHHLLHLKFHFRLEAKATEFALSLADSDLVVLDGRGGFGCGTCLISSIGGLIQELHNLRLVR